LFRCISFRKITQFILFTKCEKKYHECFTPTHFDCCHLRTIMNEEIDQNKLLNQNENNQDEYANVQRIQIGKAKKTFYFRLRTSIKRTIQEPHLLLRIFLYISVLSLGCLTCYLIVQSLNYAFFKDSKEMLYGPRSTVVNVNFSCLLGALTKSSTTAMFFSNGRRKPKKKSIFKRKCNG